MARMAWFKKERKPRTSERVKLEIPADAWEKCDQCGHIDIRDRFTAAFNVCPNCGHHRRISAQDYIDIFVDEGSWHELDALLRSTDPLRFENYRERMELEPEGVGRPRSEEHTSELQSLAYLVCRLLLEKKKNKKMHYTPIM